MASRLKQFGHGLSPTIANSGCEGACEKGGRMSINQQSSAWYPMASQHFAIGLSAKEALATHEHSIQEECN